MFVVKQPGKIVRLRRAKSPIMFSACDGSSLSQQAFLLNTVVPHVSFPPVMPHGNLSCSFPLGEIDQWIPFGNPAQEPAQDVGAGNNPFVCWCPNQNEVVVNDVILKVFRVDLELGKKFPERNMGVPENDGPVTISKRFVSMFHQEFPQEPICI